VRLQLRLAVAAIATAIPVFGALTYFSRVTLAREVTRTRADFAVNLDRIARAQTLVLSRPGGRSPSASRTTDAHAADRQPA
jgi:hypothetical protein